MGRDFVFDQSERADATYATYSEGTFAFLNRAAGLSWQRVRGLIEVWFEQLCDDAKADVTARLRSGDDRQFHAAFFELYCHETLLRLGYPRDLPSRGWSRPPSRFPGEERTRLACS